MPQGNLIFILRTANEALPINNSLVTVTDQGGNTVFFDRLNAANSGISTTATLETPPISLSLDSKETLLPYSVYNVQIRAEGNYRMEIDGIQLFENTTTRLPIELVPLPAGVLSPEDEEIIIIKIPPHILRSPDGNPAVPPPYADQPTSYQNDAVPAVIIGEGVFIPETITVHLGAPEDDAANVTVAFIDYIKNVASSEIYPTWPREALEANIIAQISLTLNRIYTEWYRSRGYNFDITNSTANDQAFVYGRNIYDEISLVVDDVFNRYLTRPNAVEPLFASYCDGSTTTCAGLSQWGTVALAEDGQSADNILGFYYGDILINQTDDIRSSEQSYPGFPLSRGAEGEDVRILQEQLNRIAINFPQLPLIRVNGIYDQSTENTVREFQRLFILPINGITDITTWYRISRIYASVKRLSELTSEGQRAAYNQQLYPGNPIKLNTRGSEVQELQFYLQRISVFNSLVESPSLDGIYGEGTRNAVISFQKAYNLNPTGVVDEVVWEKLVSIYNGTLENTDEPMDAPTPVPFPQYDLSVGARGEYVLYAQQVLNNINNVFLTIPKIAEDGIFGNETANAVNAFKVLFGYTRNGIIDRTTWDRMNVIYSAVLAECIFASDGGDSTADYPQRILSLGSRGDNVRYIQQRINRIYRAIPYVGQLEEDGIYGSKTQASVGALQRVFGLTETGVTDEPTWLLLNYIYTAVINGCIPDLNNATTAFAPRVQNEEPDDRVRVADLKELMKRNGIDVGNGPIFGLKSRHELKIWQKNNGLEPTGLPDEATRELLSKSRIEKIK